jgi:bifunctional DNase/RNase
MMTAMVKVELEDIAVSGDENQFLALLRAPNGELLPIRIDAMQAISIAAGRSREQMERPLTHDLFVSLLEMLDAPLTRVEITDLKDGTFYASLILNRAGVSFEVDARPSDAMAIAVRTSSPIYVAEKVLESSALRDDFESAGGAEA